MADTVQVLKSIAATMKAVVTPQPGGCAFNGTITPAPGNVDIVEILKGQLDLTFLTKDVRYADAKPAEAVTPAGLEGAILGGQPLSGVTPPAGVGGLLGQLSGTVPMLSETEVPVQLDVEWSVQDENGQPLDREKWNVTQGELSDTGPTPTIKGTDIAVALKPEVQELTTTNLAPPPVKRQLKARVMLKVLDKSTEWIDLPAVPVLVPTLALPKLLAAFRHGNFQAKSDDEDGFVFILVPGNSPLRSIEQLNATLSTLQTAVSSLKSFASFATFLLRLDALVGSLAASPYFAFAAADAIPDLNETTVIQNDWFTNDIELEDEFSSMIFIGPAGKVLDCFCEVNFNNENGHFKLTIGPDFFTVIRDLTHQHTNPVSDPGGMVQVVKAPSNPTGTNSFNDFLTSLRFL
ncbi:hypothetical protein ACFY7C_20945 [Streptomyces sp. NPDC012769]|uniref:hypothetical protein n=1 Tax=Streptomyces sp. NPDC012769 TaxID=3364848 RepID=UPI00367C9823